MIREFLWEKQNRKPQSNEEMQVFNSPAFSLAQPHISLLLNFHGYSYAHSRVAKTRMLNVTVFNEETRKT